MLRRVLSWKYAFAVAIILVASFCTATKDKETREQYEQKCTQLNARAVSPAPYKEDCDKGADNAVKLLPLRYRVFSWPEGATTWAILLTLLVVAEQTIETRRAAAETGISAAATLKQAGQMEKQTEILRDSVAVAKASADSAQRAISLTILKEQARIRVRIGDLNIRKIEGGVFLATVKVEVFNYGATKAFIDRNYVTFSITESKKPYISAFPATLTNEPVLHPTEKHLEKTLYHAGDIGPEPIRALNNEELFAHLYGMVSYTDVFDRSQEIHFRYLWTANGWVVGVQQVAVGSEAIDKSLYGEWQKHGDAQDNSEENPN